MTEPVQIHDVDKGWKALEKFLAQQPPAGAFVKIGVLGPAATATHIPPKRESSKTREMSYWARRVSMGSPPTVVEIASFHEFGRGVPERSFIRNTVDAKASDYKAHIRYLADQMLAKITGQMSAKKSLEIIGQLVQSNILTAIESGIPPELSEKTIKRKGSSRPLDDTGQLKSSITYATEGV